MDGFYINPTTKIDFSCSNLQQDIVLFSVEKAHEITCSMHSFDREEGKLLLEITNYQTHDQETFSKQKPKAEIKLLEFVNIRFSHLEPLLSFFEKDALKPFLTSTKLPSSLPGKLHEILFKVSLSKVQFKNGKVIVPHTLKWYREKNHLEIQNLHIVKDYEHIKFYFAKIFGRKSIDIHVKAKSSKENIELISCSSPQINSIGPSTIKVLRTKIYDEMMSPRRHDKFPSNNLLTIDDIIAQAGEEGFGNLDCTEKDLLFHLLEKHDVRNARELRYLSGSLHDKTKPLFLNLKPEIGFVFCFVGEEMSHFIWELLDTNATYIWGVPKEKGFNSAVKSVENEIGKVKSLGRTQYRSQMENSKDLYFNYVVHKTAKSSVDDPFPFWIKRIQELLI